MKQRAISSALGVILFVTSPMAASAAEATVKKATTIVGEPKTSGAKVADVAQGAKIQISERKGLWYQVTAPAAGWVKLTDIQLSTGGDASLSALTSGRSDSKKSVASTGVRGLDSEMITTGTPDIEAAKQMEAKAAETDPDKFFSGVASPRKIDTISLEKPDSGNKPGGRPY